MDGQSCDGSYAPCHAMGALFGNPQTGPGSHRWAGGRPNEEGVLAMRSSSQNLIAPADKDIDEGQIEGNPASLRA